MRSRFEVLITEGEYRIIRGYYTDSQKYPHTIIEHACPELEHRSGLGKWYSHIYVAANRGYRCCSCRGYVPEGMQASFWFLKEGE